MPSALSAAKSRMDDEDEEEEECKKASETTPRDRPGILLFDA